LELALDEAANVPTALPFLSGSHSEAPMLHHRSLMEVVMSSTIDELSMPSGIALAKPGSISRDPTSATLRFLSGWREFLEGPIRPGSTLIIEYDPDRLPNCRLQWHGAQVWGISVTIVFHPRGQTYSGSVLEEIRQPPISGAVVDLRPKAYVVTVPMDATSVEMWFHNSYRMSSSCEAWDSRFGQNYVYAVAPDGSEPESVF
jgi:hypothetical protein